MGGQALRLGPFIGALNTASDPTAIADAEVAVLKNFELDIDGSLISRTPIKESQGHISWAERILIIGEGIFTSGRYIIGSNSNGVYQFLNGTWTLITSTFQATVAIQYANTVYLVAKPGSGNGGKWDPVGGFTAIAAIPKGQAAVVHKERLFVCPGIDSITNSSRLTFSNASDFETWDASDFIDIGQGDGTKLLDLTVFQDNLLLFKNQATYVLSYDIRPADATVRKISSTIGVDRQFCVVNYENQVYIFHGGWVYEIINYDFNRLNTKVPFVEDATAPGSFSSESIFISIFEDRLVCRYFRNIYVYGLRTRTWSQWESNSDSLQYFGPILTSRPSTGNLYYAGSVISSHLNVFTFVNKATASDIEQGYNIDVSSSDDFSEVVVDGWGIDDQGIAWVNTGGAATDFDKTGTEGTHTHTNIDNVRASLIPLNAADVDEKISISTDAVMTGGPSYIDLRARHDGSTTFYSARINFNTDLSLLLTIRKRVSGAQTTLASVTVPSVTHVAGTKYTIRFSIKGSQLRTKAWTTSSSEPSSWNLTVTDTDITAAGSVEVATYIFPTNTNVLPVVFSMDNFEAINTQLTNYMIDCYVKTKNFDMAISHQFKRLWWWGVDVSTANELTGIATPIVLAFSVTWRQLESFTWRQLENNRWAQPLTELSSIITVITGAGRAARRFAKFDKALRYRQINFEVRLQTDGSTVDGPARLFTMTIVTESKATVPKAVN